MRQPRLFVLFGANCFFIGSVLHICIEAKTSKRKCPLLDVAEELGYSKPSVSRAVGIMKKDGLIVVRKDGSIELTKIGKTKAEKCWLALKL